MAKPTKFKLKCIANAHVEGDVVLVGNVAEYPADLGARLLISNRFKRTEEDVKEVTPSAAKPKTVAEYKAALDALDVGYDSDDRLADLVDLYEEATA